MKKMKWITMCFLLFIITLFSRNSMTAHAYETAIYPAPQVYVTQLAYETYSHSVQNTIDMLSGGDVFAPFTGKIVYKDANWGFVLLQSMDKVHFADGTLDYMTVGFMHDSNISDLYVGKVIKQGQKFYQAGGMGYGNPYAYAFHVDLSVFKGKVNSVTRYGRGNYFAFDSFYVDATKTKIVYPGVVEAGNRVNNGAPTNYNGLWKTITKHIVDDNEAPKITNVKVSKVTLDGYTVTCTVTDNVGVISVKFKTWTKRAVNGSAQDDLAWNTGTVSGNTYTCRMSRAAHKNEYGEYITDIYAYDAAGNSKSFRTGATIPTDLDKVTGRIIADGTYNIQLKANTGYELSIEHDSKTKGANIHLWTHSTNVYHRFEFKYVSDGYYTIKDCGSGLYMDVEKAGVTNGSNVIQWTYTGGANQLWKIVPAGGNSYYLTPKSSLGSCLDLYNGAAARGTNIQIYRENHTNAQKWVLNPISVNKQTQTITAYNVTKTLGNSAFNLGARTSGDGALTYKSSNAQVAAVSSAGLVTIKTAGTTTITITAKETALYKSAVKTVTVTVRPKTVTLQSVVNSAAGKLKIKWEKGSDISGYRLQIATNASFTSARTITIMNQEAGSTTCTVEKGKTYWIRIQTYKGNVYSAWSTVKQIAIEK